MQEEVKNILASEVGGVLEDYQLFDAPPKGAEDSYVIWGGVVLIEPNPASVARRAIRTAARIKLVNLGLTKDEAMQVIP